MKNHKSAHFGRKYFEILLNVERLESSEMQRELGAVSVGNLHKAST